MLDLALFQGPLEKSDFRMGLRELEARCYTYSRCVENYSHTCVWAAYNCSHSYYSRAVFISFGASNCVATIRGRLLFDCGYYLRAASIRRKHGTPKLSFNNKPPFSSYTNFTPQMTPERIFPLRWYHTFNTQLHIIMNEYIEFWPMRQNTNLLEKW